MKQKLFISILIFVAFFQTNAQNDSTKLFHRQYEIGLGTNYDIQNSAVNGLTVFKLTQDAYTYGVRPHLPKTLGNIVGGFWSFSFTYLAMIWPHEFGHFSRAKQVDGLFKIHNIGLPFPYTTMHLPDEISLEQNALTVIGGFEVNYLTARNIQTDFFEYNGAYNDALSLAFAHRMMYTVYTSIVIPQNPSTPETWINTGGDPVHICLPVWKNYSNGQVFMSDSSVNPGLVKYYNESSLFATFWNLADPTFYKEIAALFGDVKDGKKPWYIIGNETTGWSYGTTFNTSVLGYELYLNNFLKVNDKLYMIYFKYGRPFKNNAIGVYSPNLYENKKIKLGASVEIFDQDIYGKGFASYANVSYKFYKKLSLNIQAGYKTDGYVLGKQLNEGFLGFFSLKYDVFNSL
ncbi:MAG: hypothetical protein JXL97_00095 [Bacteroidales bacterium]|nr:hypothetical protein [Bacteroidales bacterium]